jgi:hypothetical protein
MIVYCIYLPRSSVCLCDNWKTISIISLYVKNWNSMNTHIHHFYLFIIYLCNQMSEYHKFVLLFLKIWRRTVQCDTIWNLVIHSNNSHFVCTLSTLRTVKSVHTYSDLTLFPDYEGNHWSSVHYSLTPELQTVWFREFYCIWILLRESWWLV